MKKILTLMLCLGAITPMFSQKALVDQAAKLSGKPAQLSEARNQIKQAMSDPQTKNEARTYFVAGKIEFDAFDNAFKTKMINPNDASAKSTVMGKELTDGYNYFMQALPLTDVPDSKGKTDAKTKKNIIGILKGHANDYFNAGGDYYNEKMFYPEAYETFMIYGNLPDVLGNEAADVINSSQRATAFFNAALSAYSGNKYEESANAFRRSRLEGNPDSLVYIYELACWQAIAQNDSTKAKEAQEKIMEVAKAGNEKYGIQQPIFFTNVINGLILDGNADQAINEMNQMIAQNPDNAFLYGLRGFAYDRAGNDDLSEADYRKAASLPDVDFETLKNASKKIFKIGTLKLSEIEGDNAEANQARQNIKENYFLAAQKIAEQANNMQPGDPDLQNVLDSLDYALTTYF